MSSNNMNVLSNACTFNRLLIVHEYDKHNINVGLLNSLVFCRLLCYYKTLFISSSVIILTQDKRIYTIQSNMFIGSAWNKIQLVCREQTDPEAIKL